MRAKMQALGHSKVPARVLAAVCCVVTVLSLLPLFAVSFYNHPYYDDFGAGARGARQVWQETQNPLALVVRAVQGAYSFAMHWEGNYTATFLFYFQPAAIATGLYWLVTFVILITIVLAWAYFFKVLGHDWLGASPSVCVMGASLAVFLMVQFVPHPNEGFFWHSGGMKYTMGCAFLVTLVALLVRATLCRPDKKGRRVLNAVLLSVFAFLCAGSNLMTGLGAMVGLGLHTLYLWVWRRGEKGKLAVTLALCVGLAGFAFNVLSPGNETRQGDTAMVSPFGTLVQAVYATVEYTGRWTLLPWLAALALLCPFVYQAAQKSGVRLKHPLLMLAGSFGMFAAHLAPPVYTGIYYDSGRIVNTVYFAYCLWMFLNGLYLSAWLAGRRGERAAAGGVTGAAALAVVLAMAVGCAGYGLTKMTGGAAVKALATGQAARYDQRHKERDRLLAAPGDEPVALAPFQQDVPLVFMVEPDYAWKSIKILLGSYYQKQIVDAPR